MSAGSMAVSPGPALMRLHVVTLDKLVRGVLLAELPVFRDQVAPVLVAHMLTVRQPLCLSAHIHLWRAANDEVDRSWGGASEG